jgi:hypothetical protein
MLNIQEAADTIAGGMSGSPIVTEDGYAIGIVCIGSGPNPDASTEAGPNPRLAGNLPGWVLKELADAHLL